MTPRQRHQNEGKSQMLEHGLGRQKRIPVNTTPRATREKPKCTCHPKGSINRRAIGIRNRIVKVNVPIVENETRLNQRRGHSDKLCSGGLYRQRPANGKRELDAARRSYDEHQTIGLQSLHESTVTRAHANFNVADRALPSFLPRRLGRQPRLLRIARARASTSPGCHDPDKDARAWERQSQWSGAEARVLAVR